MGRPTAVLAILPLFVARPALAEEPFFRVSVEASYSQMNAPELSLNGDDVPRRVVGLRVPSAGSFFGVGASVGLEVLPDRRQPHVGFGFDMVHVRYAWAGSEAPATEAAGPSTTTVARSGEQLLELSVPVYNPQLILTDGYLMTRIGIDWGWAYLWSNARVIGADSAGGSVDAGGPFMRFPLMACVLRRSLSKPRPKGTTVGEDICATFTPTLYEFGWFSGWSAGVRVDL